MKTIAVAGAIRNGIIFGGCSAVVLFFIATAFACEPEQVIEYNESQNSFTVMYQLGVNATDRGATDKAAAIAAAEVLEEFRLQMYKKGFPYGPDPSYVETDAIYVLDRRTVTATQTADGLWNATIATRGFWRQVWQGPTEDEIF